MAVNKSVNAINEQSKRTIESEEPYGRYNFHKKGAVNFRSKRHIIKHRQIPSYSNEHDELSNPSGSTNIMSLPNIDLKNSLPQLVNRTRDDINLMSPGNSNLELTHTSEMFEDHNKNTTDS